MEPAERARGAAVQALREGRATASCDRRLVSTAMSLVIIIILLGITYSNSGMAISVTYKQVTSCDSRNSRMAGLITRVICQFLFSFAVFLPHSLSLNLSQFFLTRFSLVIYHSPALACTFCFTNCTWRRALKPEGDMLSGWNRLPKIIIHVYRRCQPVTSSSYYGYLGLSLEQTIIRAVTATRASRSRWKGETGSANLIFFARPGNPGPMSNNDH